MIKVKDIRAIIQDLPDDAEVIVWGDDDLGAVDVIRVWTSGTPKNMPDGDAALHIVIYEEDA